jgi:hypothetical protein
VKPAAPETRKRAEVKAQKESYDKKTGTRKTEKKGFVANIEKNKEKQGFPQDYSLPEKIVRS